MRARRDGGRRPRTTQEPDEAPEGRDRRRASTHVRVARLLGYGVGGAALCGVLAFAVFPTSTYLEQRSDTSEAEERLAVLRDQNEAYEARIERLRTAEEIERIAREEYNLVFEGEEAYAVLPPPLPELDLPTLWPFGPMRPPDHP